MLGHGSLWGQVLTSLLHGTDEHKDQQDAQSLHPESNNSNAHVRTAAMNSDVSMFEFYGCTAACSLQNDEDMHLAEH